MRPVDPPPVPTPARIRRAFDRAAQSYDESAVLQTRVREELLARVAELTLAPRVVVDLGTGTGHACSTLKRRFRRAQVIGLDIAPRMLEVARRRRSLFTRYSLLCADATALPLKSASVDLVYSSLMLQWAGDLARVFAELERVLVANGVLCFATLGPDTLKELRSAYASLDAGVHVNRFLDMHDVGDALTRAGFADPVLDVERHTLTYAELAGLFSDLKAIGATALPAQPSGLRGRARRAAVSAAYEPFRRDGRLPATYEVIYAKAVRGTGPRPSGDRSEVGVPIERIKRRQ
jgi:malonyl-CoA O-methyltransferase